MMSEKKSKRDTIEVPLDLVEAEKTIVEEALRRAGGCVLKAAEILGVDRGRVIRKADKHRIPRRRRVVHVSAGE